MGLRCDRLNCQLIVIMACNPALLIALSRAQQPKRLHLGTNKIKFCAFAAFSFDPGDSTHMKGSLEASMHGLGCVMAQCAKPPPCEPLPTATSFMVEANAGMIHTLISSVPTFELQARRRCTAAASACVFEQ